MSLSLSPSAKFWVLLGIGTAGLIYLVHDYRHRRIEERTIEGGLLSLKSPDAETQKHAIEDILERVSKNKSLLSLLCANQEGGNLLLVKDLITTSNDPETQFAAVELVALLAEEEKSLDKIREAGVFQALVAVLSSPTVSSDEVTESILIAVRNCTKPTPRIVQHATGQLIRIPVDQMHPRDRNDDKYDKDDEWFSRELYQLHGLEPVVNKLLSGNEDIQILALEIIANYCKLWRNKEEVGELGGIRFMIKLLASGSTDVQSHALDALYHCIKLCRCNTAQLHKAKPVPDILSFLQNASSGASQVTQTDICNAIHLLNATIDSEGAVQIRKEGLIPQLVEYLQSPNEELSAITNQLLRKITSLDNGCKQAFALRMRGGSSNSGVTPRRSTR